MTIIAFKGRREYVLFTGWWNDAYDRFRELTEAAVALGATAWEWRAAPAAIVVEPQIEARSE